MEEVFDIYTRNGEYIGTELKSICHSKNPRGYHKPVWIWIINSNNEILVQKRAANKKNHPNKWDMPSAGHVVAGETSIQGAIRETFEELGIQTKESDYKFVFEYIQDKSFEIAQVYLLKINLDISKLNLQKEEVSEVKWISYEEFKKMFYSNEFVPFDNEYKEKVLQMMLSNFS
ncbi:MAG: NUDIX domain-containing protein [Clostridia bacterium]|nr:NUDIX domain-containing protein [Clostridia bacterium]